MLGGPAQAHRQAGLGQATQETEYVAPWRISLVKARPMASHFITNFAIHVHTFTYGQNKLSHYDVDFINHNFPNFNVKDIPTVNRARERMIFSEQNAN